ncbi:CNT_collapsed_G0024190.mRNA.1.CDS.1 [Saccharomyces cerevisiae]|nr:CNT_collapsed_G0024190.mRNA.1.CDS.1 [Saccharomyces cerevisiae]
MLLGLIDNRVLGFNLWEDGTTKSMLLVRGNVHARIHSQFLASILTFKAWITDHKVATMNASGMIVVVYIINAIFLFVFVICQLLVSLLVVRNLWVTGAIFWGYFLCSRPGIGLCLLYTNL